MQPYQLFDSTLALSREAITDLKTVFVCHQAHKNEVLASVGNLNKMYWIETGLVRGYEYIHGHDITTWIVCENQFLYAAPATLIHDVSFAHLQFLEDSTYWSCDWDALKNLYHKHPDLNFASRLVLERMMRGYNMVMYMLRVLRPKERLCYFEEHYADIYRRAPLHHIASFLGVTPETLSRVRKKIQKEEKENANLKFLDFNQVIS